MAPALQDLSEMTAIKTDDIIGTLQQLGLIQYQKGQHVLCAAPKLLEKHLKAAGSAGACACCVCGAGGR